MISAPPILTTDDNEQRRIPKDVNSPSLIADSQTNIMLTPIVHRIYSDTTRIMRATTGTNSAPKMRFRPAPRGTQSHTAVLHQCSEHMIVSFSSRAKSWWRKGMIDCGQMLYVTLLTRSMSVVQCRIRITDLAGVGGNIAVLTDEQDVFVLLISL